MKYKKYLLILFITLLLGSNIVKADEQKVCYYLTGDKKTNLRYFPSNGNAILDRKDGIFEKKKNLKLKNQKEDFPDDGNNKFYGKQTGTGINIPKINNPNECPTYIVYRFFDRGLVGTSRAIYGFEKKDLATKFNNASNNLLDKYPIKAWLLSRGPSPNENYTEEDYYGSMVRIDSQGSVINVDCKAIFGDKDNENSLAYLIDSILSYVRIIVPILLILLGTIDIGRAVVASKEDEMRKAQSTFIKRAIAAVCVFLVPALINVIMNLADIAWQGEDYNYCSVMTYKEK